MKYERADLSKVRTYPVSRRASKENVGKTATPFHGNASVRDLLDSLPHVLAADILRKVARNIADAHRAQRPVLLMMGGHVVKCGLGPIVIDLMRAGIVTAVAMNGAASIHDFEMAMHGETSEDVAKAINDGSFGMAEETGAFMNEAISAGAQAGLGMGEAIGKAIIDRGFPHSEFSILAQAYALGVPATVAVAIGTDIIHQHPKADGAALGATSHSDFRLLASVIGDLEGGVVLNVGSAVVLPEVFLKALSVARNLGAKVEKFTAVDMDMIGHYRPKMNVLDRPTQLGGEGFRLVGHHEIMLPLLAAAVKCELSDRA